MRAAKNFAVLLVQYLTHLMSAVNVTVFQFNCQFHFQIRIKELEDAVEQERAGRLRVSFSLFRITCRVLFGAFMFSTL